MLQEFGQRLRALRRGRNLTQAQLAQELNSRFGDKPHANSDAQLGKWELGLRSPSIPELTKLAHFFNVSIDFLVGNDAVSVQDIALPLIGEEQISFNGQRLSRSDRQQLFALLNAYLKGHQGRPDDQKSNHAQESLALDFGPESNLPEE